MEKLVEADRSDRPWQTSGVGGQRMIGFQPYETFQLLVESGGVERASTLLVAATEAFARRARPSASELDQFDALVKRLFATAAPSARQQAARVLAGAEYLPPDVERLVYENIGEELIELIESAPSISAEVQREIADTRNVAACAQLAARADLDRGVVAKLFAMNSRTVYRALVANKRLSFVGAYLGAVCRAARMDAEVARSLAARTDIDKAMLAPAFFHLEEPDRLQMLNAYSARRIPETALRRTYEQLSVATPELCRALMKLYQANRRPEITRLFGQITGLDEVRCGEIAHDTGGAALFVVLRAFGCEAADGLRVLVHATGHQPGDSRRLADYARLFETLSVDSMVFVMGVWRGEADLLSMARPEYRPVSAPSTRTPQAGEGHSDVDRAMAAMQRIVSTAG